MYRLCLTSVVLFALGTGASLAQGTSTPAADNIATIDSAAPTALDSSSTADSTSDPNAEPSPAVENDAQSARATKRSTRRHTTPAPTKTVETAPTKTVEIAPTKTVEIKDTGERTVCEDIGLPGSRMVVGKRCHTYNIYDRSDMKLAEEKKEQTKQTLTDLRRMEDNLEREQRQREWDRERAVAAMVVRSALARDVPTSAREMKTRVVLAFLVAGSLAASAAAQQQSDPAQGAPTPRPAGAAPPRSPLPPPEPIEHIKDNVYKIFGGGGNTLVVVQTDGVVLVDTKLPDNGPAIVSEVKKVTDKPIKLIINTHSHPDHVGSNDYLREQYPNVRIVMNEGAKEELVVDRALIPSSCRRKPTRTT